MSDDRSLLRPDPPIDLDTPKKVPFVELHDGRLQGIVSSKSSHQRVYVSYIEAQTGDFYCSTNNNRQCGGLSGGSSAQGAPCKHLDRLFEAATARLSRERVLDYLGLALDDDTYVRTTGELTRRLDGAQREQENSEIFSRFLDYLEYLDLEGTDEHVPEMSWFVT